MSDEIDLRGLVCPEPVLRTKKLIDDESLKQITVLVETEINVKNLERLAHSKSIDLTSAKEGDHYKVVLRRGESLVQETVAATKPREDRVDEAVGTVVFLGKNTFGEGDPDFSSSLLNVFLQTIYDSGHRPRAILMANSGVKLMARDCSVRPVLQQFEEAGCDVFACGLCVEFYGLKEDVPSEKITNMFSIVEYMMTADKVISP
ncbi:MAG: sulfurtransferase-like selenium metabolism protein YedF [Cyanobacteriota/Melainabacteria group bacterium]